MYMSTSLLAFSPRLMLYGSVLGKNVVVYVYMVKRYMYIMHCTYTSFYHVRFTSNYETYMCMYILVDITLVLYLRLWDTIYCIHTAKYRVQQLCMWCGLMSKVLKNGQCRAGQRPDSISCRKYTEVNNCVAYTWSSAENWLFLKKQEVLFKNAFTWPSKMFELSLCVATAAFRLFAEAGFGWRIHKLWPCVHDCSLEISHCFSLWKFVPCLSTHPSCFTVTYTATES